MIGTPGPILFSERDKLGVSYTSTEHLQRLYCSKINSSGFPSGDGFTDSSHVCSIHR